jgi:hypothetical protein
MTTLGLFNEDSSNHVATAFSMSRYYKELKMISLEQSIPTWRFWLMWFIAFTGFPIAGLLVKLLLGPINTLFAAAFGGIISGAILGLVQWLVLRGPFPLSILWVMASSVGMAVGLTVSTALLGSDTGGSALLWRALITGLCVGVLQALVLRSSLSTSALQTVIWAVTVALAWTLGWWITRSVGVDLSPKWTVFGSTGAWAFQVLTGLAMFLMLRSSQITQGVK